MQKSEVAARLARLVAEEGGRAYFVGGFVRDFVRGKPSGDYDIEVHGVSRERLFALLQTLGTVQSVGVSFGIFILPEWDMDVALPRTESRIGPGHRDFEITADPSLCIRDAAKRRDFTVNAMMMDVLTGQIFDPFGGKEDLKRGVLRHVSDLTFAEDALRVLRGAQFAARFGFSLADETLALCRTIDLSCLSRERVEQEMKKALLQAEKPSAFFEVLRRANALRFWFSELAQTVGVEQDRIFHPEGDVWTHTMQVLDRAALLRSEAKQPYAFMLLALCHDFGKITASFEKDGRIHAYGHETAGLPLVQSFLERLTGNHRVRRYVCNMVRLHMKPNRMICDGAGLTAFCRTFDEACEPSDLILFSCADDEKTEKAALFEKYAQFQARMAQPFVTGKDLIRAGIAPGENMKTLLQLAHKLRVAGVCREAALKQVLAAAKR